MAGSWVRHAAGCRRQRRRIPQPNFHNSTIHRRCFLLSFHGHSQKWKFEKMLYISAIPFILSFALLDSAEHHVRDMRNSCEQKINLLLFFVLCVRFSVRVSVSFRERKLSLEHSFPVPLCHCSFSSAFCFAAIQMKIYHLLHCIEFALGATVDGDVGANAIHDGVSASARGARAQEFADATNERMLKNIVTRDAERMRCHKLIISSFNRVRGSRPKLQGNSFTPNHSGKVTESRMPVKRNWSFAVRLWLFLGRISFKFHLSFSGEVGAQCIF